MAVSLALPVCRRLWSGPVGGRRDLGTLCRHDGLRVEPLRAGTVLFGPGGRARGLCRPTVPGRGGVATAGGEALVGGPAVGWAVVGPGGWLHGSSGGDRRGRRPRRCRRLVCSCRDAGFGRAHRQRNGCGVRDFCLAGTNGRDGSPWWWRRGARLLCHEGRSGLGAGIGGPHPARVLAAITRRTRAPIRRPGGPPSRCCSWPRAWWGSSCTPDATASIV